MTARTLNSNKESHSSQRNDNVSIVRRAVRSSKQLLGLQSTAENCQWWWSPYWIQADYSRLMRQLPGRHGHRWWLARCVERRALTNPEGADVHGLNLSTWRVDQLSLKKLRSEICTSHGDEVRKVAAVWSRSRHISCILNMWNETEIKHRNDSETF